MFGHGNYKVMTHSSLTQHDALLYLRRQKLKLFVRNEKVVMDYLLCAI